jgi:hypothetical protein
MGDGVVYKEQWNIQMIVMPADTKQESTLANRWIPAKITRE